jgi:hypothetical protein
MPEHKITYHNVSAQTYRALLDFMETRGGVEVKESGNRCSVTGKNTIINATHDQDNNLLELVFVEIPEGLEAFFWGHAYQRIQLMSKIVDK